MVDKWSAGPKVQEAEAKGDEHGFLAGGAQQSWQAQTNRGERGEEGQLLLISKAAYFNEADT